MQDAENNRQLLSRLVKILNVPPRDGARLGAPGVGEIVTPAVLSAPVVLLIGCSEHPESIDPQIN